MRLIEYLSLDKRRKYMCATNSDLFSLRRKSQLFLINDGIIDCGGIASLFFLLLVCFVSLMGRIFNSVATRS